ncbi:hypothetical protein LTR96_006926 [Exophiala xenobiotica]|nr:hypothetical protein LTR96_006926 [Exophiala xenobiotica]KAK5377318.1 hypothetical protein LTS13_004188 [Exophiala xenobiotica]KAK5393327.1 hypothetical protein LTR79_008995 [Exophiala xenobiotica]KAK5420365.1 hypothetical protein LTR90_003258 [Exophiala xenobiotica]KAK5469269.1 hypothetical protein LTR20_001779 [Exophiala xenobiotica]
MADAVTPPYIQNDYSHYKPLDKSKKEIRLIVIRPAESPRDELWCGLVRADLDDCPDYHALSYTWGSLDDTVGIKLIFHETLYVPSHDPGNSSQEQEEVEKMIESHERSVVDNFQITTNLHACLRSFRIDNGMDLFLWADMLCMNQSDLSERSHQVGFMDQVFSRATSVIAWLGGDPESPSDIFCGQEDALLNCKFDEMITNTHPGVNFTYPSEPELTTFIGYLQNQTDFNGMHQVCSAAKSMHPEVANRWPIINVVDLYIAYVYAPILCPEPENCDAHAINRFRFVLGSLLDQDTYAWQFYYVCLMTGAILQNIRSVWDDFGELLPRGEVNFTVLDRIGSLFDIPWFRRIWVVQEVTLNPIVWARHCNITVSWEVVETCASILINYGQNLGAIRDAIREKAILDPTGTTYPSPVLLEGCTMPWETNHSDDEKFENARFSFWVAWGKSHRDICELLMYLDLFEATVPRDKLYATYHLATDLPNIEFSPDYGELLEASSSKPLEAWRYCHSPDDSLPPRRALGLPEYHKIFSPWLMKSRTQSPSSESACLWYRAHLYKSIYTLAEEGIILRGAHIANVSCMVPLQKLVSFPAVWKSLSQGHEQICWHPISTCMDDQSEGTKLSVIDFLDVLFRLTPDWLHGRIYDFRDRDSDKATRRSTLRSTAAALWIAQEPDLHSLVSSPTAQAILRQLAKDYPAELAKEQLSRWTETRPWNGVGLFLSQNGSVGLCPAGANVDDLVVILDGWPAPFLLRSINTPATTAEIPAYDGPNDRQSKRTFAATTSSRKRKSKDVEVDDEDDFLDDEVETPKKKSRKTATTAARKPRAAAKKEEREESSEMKSKNRTVAAKRGQEFQLVGDCYLRGAMQDDIFGSARWSDADPLYEDPMDYDPGFTSPGGGKGYSKGFYRKRPFVIV